MYRAHCTDISYFFHVRYYVVLQVFWIGNLLRFDQRAVTCSVEWQQPYVHEAGVQVFWSGSNHMCTKLVFKYFGVATSVRELLQDDMNCGPGLLIT